MTSGTAEAPSRRRRLWPWGLAAFFAAIVIAVGVCEAMGWPFLAAPIQRFMARTLDREVRFAKDADSASTMRFGLIGSVRAQADTIFIGAPGWSKAPYTLFARDASIKFGYLDLWHAYRGGPLTIRALKAAQLDGQLERLPDGRATWQVGQTDKPDTSAAPKLPVVHELQVGSGQLLYDDALMEVDLDARFSLKDGTDFAPSSPPQAGLSVGAAAVAASMPAGGLPAKTSSGKPDSAGASAAASAPLSPDGSASAPNGLNLVATGHYKKLPLKAEVRSIGVLPIVSDNAKNFALPVIVDAVIGRARVTFNGTATDVLNLAQLRGRFSVQGPSLAAVGDPLGVTLPTTGPFKTSGLILKEGLVWNAVVEQATVGQSRLSGAFTFDSGRKTPLLSGRLEGKRLALADLGPAVGTPVKTTATSSPASKSAAAKAPSANRPLPAGRVLPDRPFDLPALRAMDANVLIDIADLDLGSSILEPLRPLRTHLVLANGVLALRDIDARTGQGNLGGEVRLDGREAQALWNAKLHWNGVRLESWIKQKRADNAPPWVTGKLDGQATLAGQGKSTAAILGSLRGGIRMYLLNGSVSHLAVEAAGLDVAQALGMLVKGDDALPIQCTVADLVVDQGLVRPRVLVLDTADSTLWIDGSLSLATEALDLRVVVTPKDFSPLALRSPIRLRGSFANPDVSVDKGPLAKRLGAAGLLALLNPLAAIVPLMDIGSSDDAKAGAAKCQSLAQRKAGKAPVAPEAAAKATQRLQARNK
ncbi:AsmA family protein [soil metagenome]